MPASNLVNLSTKRIVVIGLGYVGLPLAHAFSKHFDVTGFDINLQRIDELKSFHDRTGELTTAQLQTSNLKYSSDEKILSEANFIIVTVPTPIDQSKKPDFSPLLSASKAIGRNLKKDSIIVFESTVYPGATEEVCVPTIEAASNMKWKEDFFVGYSPERINPGDKVHTIEQIIKVVSGDTTDTLETVANVYGKIIKAGIHKAPNIKTAEAAKVIENTQRDLNIALMNELSLIFSKIGINTHDVLDAASTKWNFLKFYPGLVGGHCIGVDPYYLTFKAESIGYHPEVILAGRKINDQMGTYVANQTLKLLVKNRKHRQDVHVLICGLTFKENVPDIRNSKIIDIYNELSEYGFNIDVFDPLACEAETKHEYGIALKRNQADIFHPGKYDAVIIAVPHFQILEILPLDKIIHIQNSSPILVDCKGVYKEQISKYNSPISYFSL
jgi:UDP-N-acetyl-D-galactosamine dehydrogenase